MSEQQHITVESAYMQQNCLIQLCMDWRHRAKQLKSANHTLHNKVSALQDHVYWYRAKCHELKKENDLLRSKLASYAELEKWLSEWRG